MLFSEAKLLPDAIKRVCIAIIAIAALAAALYCQHVLGWQPCPLCVVQRAAFIGVALFSMAAMLPNAQLIKTVYTLLGLFSAVLGLAVALYHWWVLKHPGQSCGVDPLETTINALALTDIFPWMFKVDGLCTTPYPPVLGLELPVWSVLLFFLSIAVLITTLPWRFKAKP